MLSCSDWSALCNQELHHNNGILSQLLLKIRIHSFTIRFLVLGFGGNFRRRHHERARSVLPLELSNKPAARCHHEARYRWRRSCCMVEHWDRSVHMEEKMTTLCGCGGKCSL